MATHSHRSSDRIYHRTYSLRGLVDDPGVKREGEILNCKLLMMNDKWEDIGEEVTSNARGEMFNEALHGAVKELLYRKFHDLNTDELTEPCISCKTSIQALTEAIGLGGGHTLHPKIGDYWMVSYKPGIKLILTRSEGDSIFDNVASRSKVIQIAEKCLEEYHRSSVQLTLF